jgi:hypothetical protein
MDGVIYKYQLEMLAFQRVQIPRISTPLSVINQRGQFAVYAMIGKDSLEEEKASYDFRIVATGQDFDDLDDYAFLGTVPFAHGNLVYHVFCRPTPGPVM